MMGSVSSPRRASVLVSLPLLALVGCSESRSDADPGGVVGSVVSSPVEPDLLAGVSGELVLTRQRDLLDRGLVNVLTTNESGTSLLLTDVELIADFFAGEPAGPRTISLRDGRRVAIQVPYGVAVDCDSDGSVHAELRFTYGTDDGAPPRSARLDLAGTDLLDTIRTTQCTARDFDAAVETRFEDTAIVGGVLTTTLVVEPTDAAAGLTVTGVSGTILVRVDTSEGWVGVALEDRPVTIPLTFTVNRCDPHALAEVTKRFGLDLAVAADGAEPVPVPVEVDSLGAHLDAIVQQCTDAAE